MAVYPLPVSSGAAPPTSAPAPQLTRQPRSTMPPTTPSSNSEQPERRSERPSATLDPLTTARQTTAALYARFFNQRSRQWCTPHREPGTVGDNNGYTVWPVAIAVAALAENLLRVHRQGSLVDVGPAPRAGGVGEAADDSAETESARAHALRMLNDGIEGMQRHWSDSLQGFCAWHFFPGNEDIYYDDNAHCANALLTAYEATGERAHLTRAAQVLHGILRDGWDEQGEGGVAWHRGDDGGFNACSTLPTAIVAARLALLGVDVEFCTIMARRCVAFAERRLIDPADDLVWDAWVRRADGSWGVDERKFTYNTGFGVHANLLLYQLTREDDYFARAKRMAQTSTVHGNALTAPEFQQEFVWADTTFFAAHLVEALVRVVEVLSDSPGSEDRAMLLWIKLILERVVAFLRLWGCDPHDGMFFRSLRPWRIDQARADAINERYFGDGGQGLDFEADEGERETGDGSVGERRLIKTLLGNAGAANIFFHISDIFDVVNFPEEWGQ